MIEKENLLLGSPTSWLAQGEGPSSVPR
ncbi:rCG40079, isoform CRA_d [Rattus norvegicus]|uniref:RCG40079, isoform CRA_d n=1 Tax=Rattus norvegicus TaxID=10116 RepID=A6I9R6_RAT|nr:rCG40079, isoform CRA_d [Rattus norvegicus]